MPTLAIANVSKGARHVFSGSTSAVGAARSSPARDDQLSCQRLSFSFFWLLSLDCAPCAQGGNWACGRGISILRFAMMPNKCLRSRQLRIVPWHKI
jgi:hypothetical protein